MADSRLATEPAKINSRHDKSRRAARHSCSHLRGGNGLDYRPPIRHLADGPQSSNSIASRSQEPLKAKFNVEHRRSKKRQ